MKIGSAIVALVIAMAAASEAFAFGDPPPPEARVYTLADFPEAQAGAPLDHFYPKAALAQKVEGSSTVNCLTGDNGRFVRCVIVAETPADQGFGEAAVAWQLASGRSLYRPGDWSKYTFRWLF